MKRPYSPFILPALFVVILDQVSKLAVINNIRLYESLPVIKGLFNLVHFRNRGMAFGIMNKDEVGLAFYLLCLATLAAIGLLIFWFTRLGVNEKGLIFGISLILGGALGNLIDRIRLHEVVDFLDFYISTHHWPAFNIADSAVTVGTCWVAFNILFLNKER
ncbi:signal peptidase II [Thermodesulfobacteriota bacterium]